MFRVKAKDGTVRSVYATTFTSIKGLMFLMFIAGQWTWVTPKDYEPVDVNESIVINLAKCYVDYLEADHGDISMCDDLQTIDRYIKQLKEALANVLVSGRQDTDPSS